MAYTPTEWKDGDIITAERLNKLEAGVQNEQVGPQGRYRGNRPPRPQGRHRRNRPAGPEG